MEERKKCNFQVFIFACAKPRVCCSSGFLCITRGGWMIRILYIFPVWGSKNNPLYVNRDAIKNSQLFSCHKNEPNSPTIHNYVRHMAEITDYNEGKSYRILSKSFFFLNTVTLIDKWKLYKTAAIFALGNRSRLHENDELRRFLWIAVLDLTSRGLW